MKQTATARTLILDAPDWAGHLAGQHVDIRLTAPDGYQATRSYSLSSGPDERPEITVERVEGGEVSTYLVDIAEPGDWFEMRGPLGGYFIREPDHRPLVLIGGGSGVAPLRSMWRAEEGLKRILYSARTADRVIFAEELADLGAAAVTIHLTREDRSGFASGRIDRRALEIAVSGLEDAEVFVCGPTAFVESAAADLVAVLGPGHTIKTERFG